jgi:hypothetical protein
MGCSQSQDKIDEPKSKQTNATVPSSKEETSIPASHEKPSNTPRDPALKLASEISEDNKKISIWEMYFDDSADRMSLIVDDRYADRSSMIQPDRLNMLHDGLILDVYNPIVDTGPMTERTTLALCSADSLALIRSVQFLTAISEEHGSIEDEHTRDLLRSYSNAIDTVEPIKIEKDHIIIEMRESIRSHEKILPERESTIEVHSILTHLNVSN